jgi:transposase
MDVLVERCAGLDVHKDTVMAVVRRPTTDGSGREQEVRRYRTFTAALRELRAWLLAERVSQVAMEATGSYWKPVWHVLEAEAGYELLLCNPRHVKNLPGRTTDVCDAAWLAQLAECGLLRGSFVPTPVMARLRDLTRYAKKLTEERTREIQRLQRVLEESRPGARCPDCSGSVSPGRSPNPPCASRRNGLSTATAVMRGSVPRGWECSLGSGTG